MATDPSAHPTDVSQLTISALAAADVAVIVTESKLWSTKGVAGMLRTIETVTTHYRPARRLGVVIVNKHEARTIHGRSRLAEIEAAVPVLHPPVPKLTVINDAAEARVGLDEWGTARASVLGGSRAATSPICKARKRDPSHPPEGPPGRR